MTVLSLTTLLSLLVTSRTQFNQPCLFNDDVDQLSPLQHELVIDRVRVCLCLCQLNFGLCSCCRILCSQSAIKLSAAVTKHSENQKEPPL